MEDTLVGKIKAINERLGVALSVNTTVHHIKPVFLNKVTVTNFFPYEREIKVFFSQSFNIYTSLLGNTVYYHPLEKAIIFYKGKRYFLVSGFNEGKEFDDYACGVFDKEKGLLGTYKDAEDGVLSKNPVEHGSVDSVVGFTLKLIPSSSKSFYYWIAVEKSFRRIKELNNFVREMDAGILINETALYWRKWLKEICFADLSKKVIRLFKHSLLIIRLHSDSQGGILASGDSIVGFKKDNYAYVWPRDGALVARALDRMGYKEITNKFFSFCAKVISNDGYMLQKYRPDYSCGSTWHPWIREGKFQLPIQEDETALVLYALWKNYEKYGDDKFVLSVYEELVRKPSEFLLSFRDKDLKLPSESYDLWEEKFGIHTFTASTVYAGLKAAENFAKEFGYDYIKFRKASEEVREGILSYLFDKKKGVFIKRIFKKDGEWHKDLTPDISNGYGIFEFNILDVFDKRVESTMKELEENLRVTTSVGGFARYKGDKYYLEREDPRVPGNPWFISTLWLAVYYIERAKSKEDLEKPKKLLEWVAKHTTPSLLLSEQLNPYNGSPLSATPLTWSHAAFVVAVVKYLDKMEELGLYDVFCNKKD